MNGQLVFPALQAVIELSGIGVVLAVFIVADFLGLDNLVKYELFQLCSDFGGLNIGVFDLLLDVFFLVGKISVKFPTSLDIRLLFQQVQRFFNLLAEQRQILVKTIQHQHAQVAECRLEFLHVLDQEKGLQQAYGEWAFQMFLGLQNGSLNIGFQGRANPLEHKVKGGKLSDLVGANMNGHLLKYAEH